jgi:hypothetical protein
MSVSDVDIQRWLEKRYVFVPHPLWIQHCKELYLGAEQSPHRKRWHDCPPEMRLMIREAFAYFGLGAKGQQAQAARSPELRRAPEKQFRAGYLRPEFAGG